MNDRNMTDKQLEELLDSLTVEKAPASLSQKLERIPQEEGRPEHSPRPKRRGFPRWLMVPAFATVPLLVVAMVMMQPRQPSEAEVQQAAEDLATAFSYIDNIGIRTRTEIHSVLGDGLRRSVKDPLSRHMPYTEQSVKEETT